MKVYGNLEQTVKTAAVCTGSGKSMIQDVLAAGADVYVTGDIDHHTGIDTVAQGLAIIDAGHYGTEVYFYGRYEGKTGKSVSGAYSQLRKGEKPVYDIIRLRPGADGRDGVRPPGDKMSCQNNIVWFWKM